MPSRCVLALGAVLLAGCATERDPGDFFGPSEANTIVVDAVLIVGQPLGEVRLGLTADPDRVFPGAGIPLRAADVFVTRGTDQFRYEETDPGVYRAQAGISHQVLAEATYELTVIVGARTARGVTTTPPDFRVAQWVLLDDAGQEVREVLSPFDPLDPEAVYDRNRLVYADGLLEARFERPDVPAFQLGLFSLDEGSDLVIDPDFLTDEQLAELERVGGSPPLEAPDGTLRLPWFAIFFEGRYQIKAFAVDENWFDLIRSSPEFGGGPGFGGSPGDSFERPIFSIEGGIGFFGSAAVDSIGFTILPRP